MIAENKRLKSCLSQQRGVNRAEFSARFLKYRFRPNQVAAFALEMQFLVIKLQRHFTAEGLVVT